MVTPNRRSILQRRTASRARYSEETDRGPGIQWVVWHKTGTSRQRPLSARSGHPPGRPNVELSRADGRGPAYVPSTVRDGDSKIAEGSSRRPRRTPRQGERPGSTGYGTAT